MAVSSEPYGGSLADVVDQVLLAVPDAPLHHVVRMARHCKREVELTGAAAGTGAVTERAIARIRRTY